MCSLRMGARVCSKKVVRQPALHPLWAPTRLCLLLHIPRFQALIRNLLCVQSSQAPSGTPQKICSIFIANLMKVVGVHGQALMGQRTSRTFQEQKKSKEKMKPVSKLGFVFRIFQFYASFSMSELLHVDCAAACWSMTMFITFKINLRNMRLLFICVLPFQCTSPRSRIWLPQSLRPCRGFWYTLESASLNANPCWNSAISLNQKCL